MVSDPQDLAALMAAISTPMHADESLHTERLSALVGSYIGRGGAGVKRRRDWCHARAAGQRQGVDRLSRRRLRSD